MIKVTTRMTGKMYLQMASQKFDAALPAEEALNDEETGLYDDFIIIPYVS
jgi:hypothetical protein